MEKKILTYDEKLKRAETILKGKERVPGKAGFNTVLTAAAKQPASKPSQTS